jgi:hypothetical protein
MDVNKAWENIREENKTFCQRESRLLGTEEA